MMSVFAGMLHVDPVVRSIIQQEEESIYLLQTPGSDLESLYIKVLKERQVVSPLFVLLTADYLELNDGEPHGPRRLVVVSKAGCASRSCFFYGNMDT